MYPRPSLKKAKMSIIDSKSPSPKLSNPFMSAKKFEFPFNPKELKYKRGTPDFEQSDKRPNGSAYTRLKSEGKGKLDELSFTLNLDDSAPSLSDPLEIAASLIPITSANIAKRNCAKVNTPQSLTKINSQHINRRSLKSKN